MIVNAFPELDELSVAEKKTLVTNFYPKWNVFETTLMDIQHNFSRQWRHQTPCGERMFFLENFYCNEDGKPVELASEYLSLFHRCREFITFDFRKLIADMEFDDLEEVFVFVLLLCDTGYTNLSVKSVKLCKKIKSCVYRELRSYCEQKNKNELRFFEILSVLPLIERAEAKIQQELELCSLHNMEFDNEYYEIMSTPKY